MKSGNNLLSGGCEKTDKQIIYKGTGEIKLGFMRKNVIRALSFFVFTILFLVPQANLEAAENKDVIDTAIELGSLNTLVKAVGAADLMDIFKGEGPLTVFAPTDEAFAKLPPETLEMFFKPENKDKLHLLLAAHVAMENVMASDMEKPSTVLMVNGEPFSVKIKDGAVFFGNAKVIKTDIICTNGVIHLIDAVILPAE
jgi:uncharacterized surface protein with fasciclin (FAS1) repeats